MSVPSSKPRTRAARTSTMFASPRVRLGAIQDTARHKPSTETRRGVTLRVDGTHDDPPISAGEPGRLLDEMISRRARFGREQGLPCMLSFEGHNCLTRLRIPPDIHTAMVATLLSSRRRDLLVTVEESKIVPICRCAGKVEPGEPLPVAVAITFDSHFAAHRSANSTDWIVPLDHLRFRMLLWAAAPRRLVKQPTGTTPRPCRAAKRNSLCLTAVRYLSSLVLGDLLAFECTGWHLILVC